MTKKAKLTPMLQQYLDIKQHHEDTILFYRMGDFYEMFFDDAVIASKILGGTISNRVTGSDIFWGVSEGLNKKVNHSYFFLGLKNILYFFHFLLHF